MATPVQLRKTADSARHAAQQRRIQVKKLQFQIEDKRKDIDAIILFVNSLEEEVSELEYQANTLDKQARKTEKVA